MGHHPQNTRHTGEGRYLLPRRDKKTTPALRATPLPEGNLVRDGNETKFPSGGGVARSTGVLVS